MRRVTIRTEHDDPALLAQAIVPDNTEEMETTVDGSRLTTRIERETTGGLHATADDYVVNLDVAMSVLTHGGPGVDTDRTRRTEDVGQESHTDHTTATTNDDDPSTDSRADGACSEESEPRDTDDSTDYNHE